MNDYGEMFYGTLPPDTQDFRQVLAGIGRTIRERATTAGQRIVESAREARALQDQAFGDPTRPTRVTDEAALRRLTDMIMAGPMGFAPAGITKPIPQYGLMHRPMAEEGGAARLHEAYKSFGEDIYGPNALQYFGSGDPREAGIVKLLKIIKDNPEKEVTIYRGISKNAPKTINPGDWVTLDKSVAADYGDVISKKVKAKDVTTWPDALLEFGYFPK